MTFQEQCMKMVFPKLIEGINAANRKSESAGAKVDALASEVAQLQAKAQELEIQLADALDRVNMLEARVPEKKARKPRARKQADPVAMVEQAAQEAKLPEPGTYMTAGTSGKAGVHGTAGETKTVGVSGTAELPPDMQGIF